MENLKLTGQELINKIQNSNEPNWMKQIRLNALDTFKSLPIPLLKYGIAIALNNSEINFSELDLPAKKKLQLPKIKGVVIENLADALNNDSVKNNFLSTFQALGKFESLHALSWNKGVLIYVPKNTNLEEPINLKDINDSFESQHNLIILDENSSATIFEEESSSSIDNSYKTKITEIFVNNNSTLNYANFQNLSQNTINFSSKRAVINQNSTINWVDCCLGSKLTKSEIITNLNKEGSNTNLYSLFFSNNQQQFDMSASIYHNSKHTKSDMAVKGVLDGKSKVIYNGLVKIAEKASNSNGYQKQDALLLSPNAEIDPIPNLEIDNNDVKCSHGTTVSRIDKEKLFYLKSRGIPEQKAVHLMIKGFFEPLIRKIEVKEARKNIRRTISFKL